MDGSAVGRELMPDVSIVVPCFRAAESLPVLVPSIVAELEKRGVEFEIVLVNDASPDTTWETIRTIAAGDDRVIGVDLLHNHGQPLATLCGMDSARGNVVVTMDDDGEHPPAEIHKLLDALDHEPDWDAVVGSWHRRRSRFRNLGTRLHSMADSWAWGTPRAFDHTAFRAMRRPVRTAIVDHPGRQPVIGPMLHRLAANVHNVEVQHGSRNAGESGFTVRDGVRRVLRNYMAGSTFPLVAMSLVGFAVATIAIFMACVFLARWALGADPPSGWLSSIVATTFLSGVILFCVGILGHYVAFLVRESNIPGGWNIRRTTASVETRRRQNIDLPSVLPPHSAPTAHKTTSAHETTRVSGAVD